MSGGRRAGAITACVGAALGLGGWATTAEGGHPAVAGALYVLALVAAGVAIALMFIRNQGDRVALQEWREQEDRFGHLNTNIEGHYNRDAGSRVMRWSIWPSQGATPRDRELFTRAWETGAIRDPARDTGSASVRCSFKPEPVTKSGS